MEAGTALEAETVTRVSMGSVEKSFYICACLCAHVCV